MDAAVPPGHAVVEPPLADPRDLRRADLQRVARAVVAAFQEDNLLALASGLAFNLFLSLFPSTLAVIAVYGLVGDAADVARFVARLQERFPVLPPEVLDTIESVIGTIVSDESNGRVALAGIALGLFSASGAAAALINGLNRAYRVREQRNVVKLRLTGLLIAAALLVALAALVVTVVLGPQVRDRLVPPALEGTWADVASAVGQFLIALLVLLVLFAFIYWVGPYRPRPPWRWLSGGTVLAVAGWLLVSGGFGLYTSVFANFDENPIYAGFGGFIVLLLWLQLSMLVILVGAEVNAELERIRDERARARAAVLGEAAAETPAPPPRRARRPRTAPVAGGPAPDPAAELHAGVVAALGPAVHVPEPPAAPAPRVAGTARATARRSGRSAAVGAALAAAGLAAGLAAVATGRARRLRARRR